MNRRTLIAGAIAATAPIALITAAPAVAGLPPVDYGMRITVTGPGTVGAPDLRVSHVTNFEFFGREPTITLTPTPQGNYAEFMGWTGACASAGQGPCTITLVPERSTECLWAGARFERPGEPVAVPVDPCTTPGGGGPGGGAGTGGGDPVQGGGGGASAALPPAGTVLAGGATVVRRAPALRGARTTVRATGVRSTGTLPAGATKVVQSLVLVGQPGVTAAGRCRVSRATATYTCISSAPKGRWRVLTQARKGAKVVGQATSIVRVR